MLDADEAYSLFAETFPELAKSDTITRPGADKGKILIRVIGKMPAGKKWKHNPKDPPYFEFLSTGNQGVVAGIHTSGQPYGLQRGSGIIELTVEQLDAICRTWTGTGLDLETEQPKPEQASKKVYTSANGDGLREAVEAYWTPLEVFKYHGWASDTVGDRQSEFWRLKKNGGLLVEKDGDGWCMAGQTGVGGGPFQAWQYCKTGDPKTPKGHDFYNLLVEMARAAGIEIPERKHQAEQPEQPTGEDPKKPDKSEKTPSPDQAELERRWCEVAPKTMYGLGEWRRYTGGIWEETPADAIKREIKSIVFQARPEGIRPTDSMIRSVMELARLEVVEPDDSLWDASTDRIVCKNGTFYIPTMALEEHSPGDYATFRLEFDYDPEATAPTWQYFLASTVPDVQDFLQEFAGYCLTTDTQHELALWLVGKYGSGKSTLIEGIQTMLGKRVVTLGLANIEQSRFSLGNLAGKTLAVATEQPAIYMQATHILNAIISGEILEVERKFRDPVNMRPYAKIIWAMNDMPRVPDAANGLFRRVKVIKFPPIPEKDRDPRIKEAIKTEGAGILNWALEGLRRLRARGRFEIPECVKSATADFQRHNDIPALFVEECCLTGPDYKTQANTLYQTYKKWCEDSGHKPMSSTSLAGEWERLSFEKYSANGRHYYRGVGVLLEGEKVAG